MAHSGKTMTFKADLLPENTADEYNLGNATQKWKLNGGTPALVSDLSAYVLKTGDTMTGTISSKASNLLRYLDANDEEKISLWYVNDSSGVRHLFRQYRPSGTYRENYNLPSTTDALTANVNYNILTTKNVVTVAQGGTGTVTLSSGEALIGNGTGAVQTRSITNNTTIGNLGWGSTTGNGINLVTMNTIAYWNGRYGSSSSNLQYCKLGEFGSMAVASADDYLPLAGGAMTGQLVLSSSGLKTSNTAGYITDQYGNPVHQRTSTSDTFQIKNNASKDVLVVGYESGNVTASGTGTFNGGTLTIHADTTTAADTPAKLAFTTTDTDVSKSYNGAYIGVYNDHADTYGANMVIHSGGGMFIGGGESSHQVYQAVKGSGTYTGEQLWLCADSVGIYFDTACNGDLAPSRVGMILNNTGELLPTVADVATNNKGSLGNSSYAWGNLYASNIQNANRIELRPAANNSNNGGYIDFHYNQSTADYTSRIIESASGTLNLIGHVDITGGTGMVVKGTGSARVYVDFRSDGDYAIDLRLGRQGANKWSISSRNSTDAYLGLYNFTQGAWVWTIDDATSTTKYLKPVYINVTGDTASGTGDGGALVIGDKDGDNIAFDGNEIIARNNKASATLYLQTDGGSLVVGNSTAATSRFNGLFSIFSTGTSFNQGIRLHSGKTGTGNLTCLMFCGSDNTGNTGTSAKTWGLLNNDGNLYLSLNGYQTSSSAILSCVSNAWSLGGSSATVSCAFTASAGVTFSNKSFNYSGIETASANAMRGVWFSDADVVGKPCINTGSFTHNPYSGAVEIKNTTTGNDVVLKVINTGKGNLATYLDTANSGNHGLYSNGYWNGSAFVSSGKWLIYRNTSNVITVNGNCTGTSANVTGTVAIDHGGTGATTAVAARKALCAWTTNTNWATVVTNAKAGIGEIIIHCVLSNNDFVDIFMLASGIDTTSRRVMGLCAANDAKGLRVSFTVTTTTISSTITLVQGGAVSGTSISSTTYYYR